MALASPMQDTEGDEEPPANYEAMEQLDGIQVADPWLYQLNLARWLYHLF